MKILKPGKVEMRKFVCPRCGCVFVAHEDDVSEGYVSCPQEGCGYNQNWERKGEPYEEPTPTQTSRERPTELLMDGDLVEELKRMCRYAYLQRCDF